MELKALGNTGAIDSRNWRGRMAVWWWDGPVTSGDYLGCVADRYRGSLWN